MKTLFCFFLTIATLDSFSQLLKHDIKWQAEVIKVSNEVYDIRFTLTPSKKWWISSPLQDSSENNILPTQFNIINDRFVEEIGTVKEDPVPPKTMHSFGETIKWAKSKTVYTQRIKLTTKLPFKYDYIIYFQPYSENAALSQREITGEIIYSQNKLKIALK